MTENLPFTGYLNGLDPKWRIIGWVRFRDANSRRPRVQLFAEGTMIAEDTARRYRGDLRDANIGDAEHGFVLPICSRLFDGKRHLFNIVVYDGPRFLAELGSLDLAMPSRPPPGMADNHHPALGSLLQRRSDDRPEPYKDGDYRSDVISIVKQLAERYDAVTALAIFHTYAHRVQIDPHTEELWTTRIAIEPDSISDIVSESLTSREQSGALIGQRRFPTACLRVWLELDSYGD